MAVVRQLGREGEVKKEIITLDLRVGQSVKRFVVRFVARVN